MNPREYVTEQLSIIIGAPVQPTAEQVARFWAAFTRAEEAEAPRDVHGKFRHPSSRLAELGLLEDPPLHADLQALAQAQPATLPRWPNGHRFAACLTHDVDRIVRLPWRERARQAAMLRGKVPVTQMGRWLLATATYAVGSLCGFSNLAPYDPWIAEEERYGYHSTFFVLPERLIAPTRYDHYYRYRDGVRWRGQRMSLTEATRNLRAAGWDVGLHGSYASAENLAIFQQEKEWLEEMLDAPVLLIRQHFLRFNAEVTPRLHAQAGIQADTTLGYSATIGCRAGLAVPFFWPMAEDVLEVPLVIQDVGMLRVPGTVPDLQAEIARARALIARVADAGGVVTLSWHTQPDFPGAYESYRALLETVKDLNGWGCSLGELNAWWRARRAQVRQLPPGATTETLAEKRTSDHEQIAGIRNRPGLFRASGPGSPGV